MTQHAQSDHFDFDPDGLTDDDLVGLIAESPDDSTAFVSQLRESRPLSQSHPEWLRNHTAYHGHPSLAVTEETTYAIIEHCHRRLQVEQAWTDEQVLAALDELLRLNMGVKMDRLQSARSWVEKRGEAPAPHPSLSEDAIEALLSKPLGDHEVIVLLVQEAIVKLFAGKKRLTITKRVRNARRIIEEIIPAILVRGHALLKLGTSYIARELGITTLDVREAKQLLREQGIITLVENSRAGVTVARWALNKDLYRVEERHFKNMAELRYHWIEALGEEKADRLWVACLQNTMARRSPQKLIAFSRSMEEESWEEILEGVRKPTLCE